MISAALRRPEPEFSFVWLEPDDDVSEVVAQRAAIYGQELGWLGEARHSAWEAAWDEYDLHSSTLVVYSAGRLCASSRLTIETRGPLEVSDLVAWKPETHPAAVAAEWSRVMIAEDLRHRGLFRAMYAILLRAAQAGGATLLAGASVAELRPLYERLGFDYLDRPFRSPFFVCSPVYYPAYQVLT